MPPTDTSVSRSPVRAWSRASTSTARLLSGAPESPPAPAASTLAASVRSPSRPMVVLVAMIPSSPSSSARSATSSMSASARSGAILTSSGIRRCGTSASSVARTALSSGRSWSTAWRLRSPGVFGELTLTTK